MQHIYDILLMNFAAIHTSSNVSTNYFIVVVVVAVVVAVAVVVDVRSPMQPNPCVKPRECCSSREVSGGGFLVLRIVNRSKHAATIRKVVRE